ncbi:MAG: ArsR family transcriptional regulator [Marine Group I thaumarchaeote]|nr:MAG: ArsR family transcriptional regulator [Marine Group I thaumarchaeote]
MPREYQTSEIKKKLIDTLRDSRTGLTGIELAEKLGVNRVTMTKYLNIFAAEGFVKQKHMGKISLWYIEKGVEQLTFPSDFFRVKSKYYEYLIAGEEHQVYSLIRNSYHSGAVPQKLIIDAIVPAIHSVNDLYKDGKIGNSEKKFLDNIVSNSIQILNLLDIDIDSKKNVIIISADANSALLAEATSAALHVGGWKVSYLGDLSSAIDVLFDIDIQKFLNKNWKQKQGIMVVVVFSTTEEGLKFFSESIVSGKSKYGKSLHLALCSKYAKKSKSKADFVSDEIETLLQWSDTTYESYLQEQ